MYLTQCICGEISRRCAHSENTQTGSAVHAGVIRVINPEEGLREGIIPVIFDLGPTFLRFAIMMFDWVQMFGTCPRPQ